MGNTACSLRDSRDRPPCHHLARLTVLITVTLAFMKYSTQFWIWDVLNLGCPLPTPPPYCIKVLTCIDCTFFIKAWIAPFLVPTSSMSNVIRERTIKCRMLLNPSCKWNLIWARSRLEVISAFCSGAYVLSPFLFRLFGLKTRCRIFSDFLVACLSFLCLDPLACREPWLERLGSVCAWDILSRSSVFFFFLTSVFHAASLSHVFGRGWQT